MTTKNPRILVTLPPEVHQALKDLADVSGIAVASYASKLITDNYESILMMKRTYQLAQEGIKKAAADVERDPELFKYLWDESRKQARLELHDIKPIKPVLHRTPRKNKK